MIKDGTMYADDGLEIRIGDRLVSEWGKATNILNKKKLD